MSSKWNASLFPASAACVGFPSRVETSDRLSGPGRRVLARLKSIWPHRSHTHISTLVDPKEKRPARGATADEPGSPQRMHVRFIDCLPPGLGRLITTCGREPLPPNVKHQRARATASRARDRSRCARSAACASSATLLRKTQRSDDSKGFLTICERPTGNRQLELPPVCPVTGVGQHDVACKHTSIEC